VTDAKNRITLWILWTSKAIIQLWECLYIAFLFLLLLSNMFSLCYSWVLSALMLNSNCISFVSIIKLLLNPTLVTYQLCKRSITRMFLALSPIPSHLFPLFLPFLSHKLNITKHWVKYYIQENNYVIQIFLSGKIFGKFCFSVLLLIIQ
jgi:hypothetical protein